MENVICFILLALVLVYAVVYLAPALRIICNQWKAERKRKKEEKK